MWKLILRTNWEDDFHTWKITQCYLRGADEGQFSGVEFEHMEIESGRSGAGALQELSREELQELTHHTEGRDTHTHEEWKYTVFQVKFFSSVIMGLRK